MFCHLSSASKDILLRYFNLVWKVGEVPSIWRHGIIVPILKLGKVKSDPISYKPIALTSNLCKLMERWVTFCLTRFLEKYDLLNRNQSGFHSKRNTMDQLLRSSNDILKGIGEGHYTLGIFLDIEKAYDTV